MQPLRDWPDSGGDAGRERGESCFQPWGVVGGVFQPMLNGLVITACSCG